MDTVTRSLSENTRHPETPRPEAFSMSIFGWRKWLLCLSSTNTAPRS